MQMLYTYWCKWRNNPYPLYHVYVHCLQTIWHHNEGKWHNKEISGITSLGKGVTMVNRPCLKPNHMECIQVILAGKSGKKKQKWHPGITSALWRN